MDGAAVKQVLLFADFAIFLCFVGYRWPMSVEGRQSAGKPVRNAAGEICGGSLTHVPQPAIIAKVVVGLDSANPLD